jgi:Zn-dependent protease
VTPDPAPAAGWKGLELRLGSIPVLLRPMFFLVAVLLGVRGGAPGQGAVWVAIVFFSVLIHELGHALAMRAFGFSPSIELHAMGGVTLWSREKVPTVAQRLIVTLCGPGAGLLLGGLVTVVRLRVGSEADPLLQWALLQAQYVNVGWSVINLMPVLPWDGGLIVDAAIELGSRRPRPKAAAVISVVVGGAIAAIGVWKKEMMLVYFGGMGVWRGWARFSPPLVEAASAEQQFWSLMQAQRFAEAERLALEKLAAAEESARAGFFEWVAWSRLLREDWAGVEVAIAQMKGAPPSKLLSATLAAHTGRPEEVLALLTPVPTQVNELRLRADALIALGRPAAVVADAQQLLSRPLEPPQALGVNLLSARLFDGGFFDASLQVCTLAFGKWGDPVQLFNAACALARLNRADEGLAMLHRAIDAGYQERPSLLEDPDLAPMRALAGWDGLIARLPLPAI